jgi:hypothetical protein
MAVTMKNAVFWEWCRVGFVSTDVLEEHVICTFRVEKISELGTALAVTSSTQ